MRYEDRLMSRGPPISFDAPRMVETIRTWLRTDPLSVAWIALCWIVAILLLALVVMLLGIWSRQPRETRGFPSDQGVMVVATEAR